MRYKVKETELIVASRDLPVALEHTRRVGSLAERLPIAAP